MTGERPSDAQVDAVVSEMVAAGLLTVGHDIEGREIDDGLAERR